MHRWNSGRSALPLTLEDTLFEGFDCEDAVQSFLQIKQTAGKYKDALLRRGAYLDVFVYLRPAYSPNTRISLRGTPRARVGSLLP